MLLKIHPSYRKVVAICDEDLIGKKFTEGIRQLDLRENFYKGDKIDSEKAVNKIRLLAIEDSTFNIVGKESVETAIKAGIMTEKNVGKVADIPFALVF